MILYIILAISIASIFIFMLGRGRAVKAAGSHISSLHSKPAYHGGFLAVLTLFPALLVTLFWGVISGRVAEYFLSSRLSDFLSGMEPFQRIAFLRDAQNLALAGENRDSVIVSSKGEFLDAARNAADTYLSIINTSSIVLLCVITLLAVTGFLFGIKRIKSDFRARHFVEKFIMGLLIACSVVAILTTIGIVLSLIFESIRFFQKVSMFDFLFGYHWSPQNAFEGAGQDASSADYSRIFGAIPLFTGTFLITFIAIAVAAPFGLMSAIYMSDYASSKFRAAAKPIMEILAGIPTVVYGFFAALTVAPAIRGWGEVIGISVASESALATGLVMGVMIIPFVMSLSDDVINAVPQSLRDGSYAMGATKSETIRKVVLPAALPGIVAALLLAISRAVGETMIVVMAASLSANLTINPLEAVTTVTVQIVSLLQGDQEFDSAKTLAAFALGLVLFIVTLCLNILALRVVQKYREQYD